MPITLASSWQAAGHCLPNGRNVLYENDLGETESCWRTRRPGGPVTGVRGLRHEVTGENGGRDDGVTANLDRP